MVAAASLAAQQTVAGWWTQHERQIVEELPQLLAIPNVASVDDLQKNADALSEMFRKRGFTVELWGENAPVVYARLDAPQARGTVSSTSITTASRSTPPSGPWKFLNT